MPSGRSRLPGATRLRMFEAKNGSQWSRLPGRYALDPISSTVRSPWSCLPVRYASAATGSITRMLRHLPCKKRAR